MAERIELHPDAVEEARAAREWYEVRSQDAADAFVEELDRAIEQIAESPTRWPLYLQGTRRFLLRKFPFFFVYRQIEGAIQIVALAHGHRRPGYWKSR